MIVALNGVLGAVSDGAEPSCSPSCARGRPTFRNAPTGPRKLARAWFAASTSAGLRVAFPSSRVSARREEERAAGLAGERHRGSCDHLAITRHPLAVPRGRGRGDVVTSRVAVEHHRQQLRARRPVDSGVVELRQDREPVVGKSLDDVALPERPAPVERSTDDPRGQLGELFVGARRGQRVVPHVEVEVEVGVLDPERMVEGERHGPQAAPQWLEQVEATLDLPPPGRVRVVVRVVGPLVHRHTRHVAELRAGLHVEEGRIEPTQLLHRPSRRGLSAVIPV